MEFPESKENTTIHERLAGAVGYPSRVSRLQFWNRSLAGFPGGNIIECCGRKGEKRVRLEGRDWRQNEKCQMSKLKVPMAKSKWRNLWESGKTSSERESKIFELRRASFFETSSERLGPAEMSNDK